MYFPQRCHFKASGNYAPNFAYHAIPNFPKKIPHYAHYYSFNAPHCYYCIVPIANDITQCTSVVASCV